MIDDVSIDRFIGSLRQCVIHRIKESMIQSLDHCPDVEPMHDGPMITSMNNSSIIDAQI
jgi:hypothetical protein